MSKDEIEIILKKLPEEDREKVISYINNHEAKILRLERNLATSADILQAVLEQTQSIQASINAILRAMAPVLRVREPPRVRLRAEPRER